MKVVYELPFFRQGCTAALGTFDGVHLGHNKVISAVTDCRYTSVVVMILQCGRKMRIFSDELNLKYIEKLGIDTVICLPLDNVRNLSAYDYLQKLCDSMNVKKFACGFDHRFGKGAAGTPEFIADFAKDRGIEFTAVKKVQQNGDTVSSTAIRRLIADGDMQRAALLLGHDYQIDFDVTHGDARGRKMGFPTINQVYPDGFILPRFGVYASRVTIDGIQYASVTNIGIRPTFAVKHPLAETHIIGFSGDLYDRRICVTLSKFMREECRFDSVEQLICTIDADKNNSIELFKNRER